MKTTSSKVFKSWGPVLSPLIFVVYIFFVEFAIYEDIYPYVKKLPYYPEEIESNKEVISRERCKNVIALADDGAVDVYGSLHKIHLTTSFCALVFISVLAGAVWKRDKKITRLLTEERT